MKATLEIIICGFTGRMGQAIARIAGQNPSVKVIGATSRSGLVHVSQSLEVAITSAKIPAGSKPVIIDFSHSDCTVSNVQAATKHGLPLIVGSTGLQDEQFAALQKAAEQIPVLVAPNMSMGANVLYALTRLTASLLEDADVEISEIHHRDKKDCPSGTAYNLAKIVAEARNQDLQNQLVLHRGSQKPRKSGEIGVMGLRGGNVKGDHSVYFFSENESIELKHHVDDPVVFAQGALKAAWYLVSQKPGVHNMMDVLGIKTL
jgi:4-hydroxy-tetrahydrodipicolinate reductase